MLCKICHVIEVQAAEPPDAWPAADTTVCAACRIDMEASTDVESSVESNLTVDISSDHPDVMDVPDNQVGDRLSRWLVLASVAFLLLVPPPHQELLCDACQEVSLGPVAFVAHDKQFLAVAILAMINKHQPDDNEEVGDWLSRWLVLARVSPLCFTCPSPRSWSATPAKRSRSGRPPRWRTPSNASPSPSSP